MRRRLSLAVKASYAVTSALAAIDGINIGVTIFPAASPDGQFDLEHPNVLPLIRHGERIHSRFGMLARGDTPMGEALWWVLQQMVPLSESRKLILILTDGHPGTPSNARKALEEAHRSGFEICGLGIKSNAISDLLPNTSRIIHDLNELAPAMFDLLQRSLLTHNR